MPIQNIKINANLQIYLAQNPTLIQKIKKKNANYIFLAQISSNRVTSSRIINLAVKRKVIKPLNIQKTC